MTTVAFYTEAGLTRGMGHLVRCYTLFQYFQKQNLFVEFFLDSDIDYSQSFAGIKPFKWDRVNCTTTYDIIFIDSYEADISQYNKLQSHSQLCVYIDDFQRLSYPAGIIINFAPKAPEMFKNLQYSYHKYLLGIEYIPIREMFLDYKPRKQDKIFIMLGGSDPQNLTQQIVESIQSLPFKKVVISTNQKASQQLASIKNITLLYKPSDTRLISEMSTSSIAITTASMSAYELAYFQIPNIILATSKNQQDGVTQFLEYEIADKYLDITSKDWKIQLLILIKNLLASNITKKQILDGLGSKRIYETIIKEIH